MPLCAICKGQLDIVMPLVELSSNGSAPVQVEFVSCPTCKIISEINIISTEYRVGTSIFVDTRKGTIRGHLG